jgi:hypothetical protein
LIESRVTRLLNGELRVGALTGSFWGGVTLANVSIVQAGTAVISVASIDVRYRPWQVFRAGVVDNVILTGLRADIVENADGWNVARLAAPRPASTGPGPSISIDHLQLVASEVDIRPRDATPRRIVELNLQGALKVQSRTTRITIEETTARDVGTGVANSELAGVLRFQERTMAVDALRLATARSRLTGQVSMTTLPTGREVDVALEAAPLSVPELAAYFPQLSGVTVVPTARMTMRGPLDRLQVGSERRHLAIQPRSVRPPSLGAGVARQHVLVIEAEPEIALAIEQRAIDPAANVRRPGRQDIEQAASARQLARFERSPIETIARMRLVERHQNVDVLLVELLVPRGQ